MNFFMVFMFAFVVLSVDDRTWTRPRPPLFNYFLCGEMTAPRIQLRGVVKNAAYFFSSFL